VFFGQLVDELVELLVAHARRFANPRPRMIGLELLHQFEAAPPRATDKQIAANRANAERSSGPKTFAGKVMSSRKRMKKRVSADFARTNPTSIASLVSVFLVVWMQHF
jgi:hypothetical protein